jgi:hypothetical protein
MRNGWQLASQRRAFGSESATSLGRCLGGVQAGLLGARWAYFAVGTGTGTYRAQHHSLGIFIPVLERGCKHLLHFGHQTVQVRQLNRITPLHHY